ncbi:SET domain-containing protein [Mycena chlorophos]|uniref:SET domain-containing protein n=1 Tax=Mycena chlorophos TaxID=658473 RepID=A0A8H6VXQ5_MYCCL|nr:SET domain-containing protein [Mycena chlorophos]
MKRGFLLQKTTPAPGGIHARAREGRLTTEDYIAASARKETLPCSIGKLDHKVELPADLEDEYRPHREARNRNYEWLSMPPNASVTGEPATECILFKGSKELLLSTPGFPQPLPPLSINPAFRVGPVPGKGLGLFATRSLKQGDLILTERPLLILPATVHCPFPTDLTGEQILQHQLNDREQFVEPVIERMTEERRDAFFRLHNSHTEDGSGPITGIVRTNGIGMPVAGLKPRGSGESAAYSAIGDAISRLNHSCTPNTEPSFSLPQLAYRLYAVRDIAEGEELTWRYTDSLAPKAERDESHKPYGFTCDCPVCTDVEHIAESDARRLAISKFDPTSAIMEWAGNPSLPDNWIVKKCLEQLILLEKENLQHCYLYPISTRTIMDAYIMLGDAQRASTWAANVKKRCWAEDFEPVDEYLDPKSAAYRKHQLWGARAGLAEMWKAKVQEEKEIMENMARLMATYAAVDGQPQATFTFMTPGFSNEAKAHLDSLLKGSRNYVFQG